MKQKALIPVLAFGAVLTCAAADPPAENRQRRYVNPLAIENSGSIADPAVIRYQGKYLLFLSGGLVWTSSDLVNWKHNPITLPGGRRVTAPHAFEHGGFLYLTGNDTGLYRSRDPFGQWEYIGDFKDHKGDRILLFDPPCSSTKTDECTSIIRDGARMGSTAWN